MRTGSHRDAHAASIERFGDALVIGGDPDFACPCRQRAAGDMQHERFTCEQAQRLAGQARSGVSGRNGDYEIGCAHWVLAYKSVASVLPNPVIDAA
jgi:hypothetical protein